MCVRWGADSPAPLCTSALGVQHAAPSRESASATSALDVGFYYSANAAGRLVGTVLSGLAFLTGGIVACLWVSTSLLLVSWLCTLFLPKMDVHGPESTQVPSVH